VGIPARLQRVRVCIHRRLGVIYATHNIMKFCILYNETVRADRFPRPPMTSPIDDIIGKRRGAARRVQDEEVEEVEQAEDDGEENDEDNDGDSQDEEEAEDEQKASTKCKPRTRGDTDGRRPGPLVSKRPG